MLWLGCGPSLQTVSVPAAVGAVSPPLGASAPTVRVAPVLDARDDLEVANDEETRYQLDSSSIADYIGGKFCSELAQKGFKVVAVPATGSQSETNPPSPSVLIKLKWATASGNSSQVDGELEISVQVEDSSGAVVYDESFKGRGQQESSGLVEKARKGLLFQTTAKKNTSAIGAAFAAAADAAVANAMKDSDLVRAARPSPSGYAVAHDSKAEELAKSLNNLGVGSPAPAAGPRIALVVGNSEYRNVGPLTNPANDAALMAGTLSKLGFELVGGKAELNLDKPAFDRAVYSFGHRLPGASVALFYYAGHGFQVDGANYLVPVSAKLSYDKPDLDFEMVNAQTILNQMQDGSARLNILILDACRNNPFHGKGNLSRSVSDGLAPMDTAKGTLISYATQPGAVAADGEGRDSLYTEALAQTMLQPGLNIFATFNQVGVAVEKATKDKQVPWVSNSPIEGDFYFVR